MMLVPNRDFDLFDDIFGDPFFRKSESKMMKTDIREDKDNYVIDIDLPGFDKKNIKIDITDGYLTINAKVNNEDNDSKKGKYIRKERFVGKTSRSFYVGDIDQKEISAKLENGTLVVNVQKEHKNDER
mgnify:CR=1 FL=1